MPLPVNPRTRPTRAQTRARVLEAAAYVFARSGYDASLDDVALRAGLTKGAIYSSFPSKDALLAELVGSQIEQRLDKVGEAIDAGGDSAGVARRVGRALSGGWAVDPGWQITFIEFWVRAMRLPELRAQLAEHRAAAHAAVSSYIERQSKVLGVTLPMSPGQVATTILALSNGLAIEGLLRPDDTDPELLGTVLELIFTTRTDNSNRSRPAHHEPRHQVPPSGPAAVLLTGVFGVGKSTLAADLADLLDEIGAPVAALDLDWLTWTNVSVAGRAGEHDMMLTNLRPIIDRYRSAGARYFVLARTIRDLDERATLAEALAMPLSVVEVTIPFDVIARRLAADPTDARQRDLAQSERWMSEHSSGIADSVVVNDRSVRELAVEILGWLGWPTPASA